MDKCGMADDFIPIGETKRNEMDLIPFINVYCGKCRKHFEVDTKFLMLEEYHPIHNWNLASVLCICGKKTGLHKLPQTVKERDRIIAYNKDIDERNRKSREERESKERTEEYQEFMKRILDSSSDSLIDHSSY